MHKYLILFFLSLNILNIKAELPAKFIRAMHQVESSGKVGLIYGDNFSSIGPLMISKNCWIDSKVKGDDLAYILMKLGLLTKASHDYSIRLAPALIIKEKEVVEASNIIKEGFKHLEILNKERSN